MTMLFEAVSSALDAWAPGEAAVCVAVSGGADSMALCLLAEKWAAERGKRIIALTVDHRLRPESEKEAKQVAAWCAARGIEHHLLVWRHDLLTGAVEEKARAARYRLMLDWCHRNGVKYLLLGHHLQDQAETFLMRLQSGAGADGLAGMAAVSEREGVLLLRPFLSLSKESLLHYLKHQRQEWLEDPSNADPAHARNRLRALLPSLESQGITVQKLAEAARQFGLARAATDHAMQIMAEDCITLADAGYAAINLEKFRRCPEAIGARLLARLIRTLGGAASDPRSHELERLCNVLKEPGFPGATLGGCEFLPVRKKGGESLALREAEHMEGDVAFEGSYARWDGRFTATTTGKWEEPLFLGALGRDGAQALAGHTFPGHMPKKALHTLPAIKTLDEILYVPHIAYMRPTGQGYRIAFAPRQAFPGMPFIMG